MSKQSTEQKVDYEKEFSKLLNSIHNHRKYEVFKDFVIMSAIMINNQFVRFDKELEQEYLKIAKKYTKEQLIAICKMNGVTALALSEKHQDFLGRMYMKNELGNRDTGQCFTPYNVCKLLAAMTIEESKNEETLNDCCCGGGAHIIAAHEIDDNIIVVAQDIDFLCVCMCYVQLSLLNIKAAVYHSNTLTLETWFVFYTPALVHSEKAMEIITKENQNKSKSKTVIRSNIQKPGLGKWMV